MNEVVARVIIPSTGGSLGFIRLINGSARGTVSANSQVDLKVLRATEPVLLSLTGTKGFLHVV